MASEPQEIKGKGTKYTIWFLCNILIPLAPFFFKWIVTKVSTNQDIQQLNVLEPSDLLYYSFILCWIFICDIILKNKKPVIGLIICTIIALLSLWNVISIIISYSEGITSEFTRIYSYSVTIFVIFTACIYKSVKE